MSSSPWRGSVVTRCREPCSVSCVSFLSWWQSRPGDSTGGWGTVTPSETTRTTRSGRSRAVLISDLDSLFQISNNQYQDNGQVQGELFILHYSFFQHSILITLPRKLPSIKYVQSQDIVKNYSFYNILHKNFCSLYCFALKHRTFFVVLWSKMRLHSTRLISIQTENIRLPSIILVCHHSQHPAREIQPDAKNVYFVSNN